MQVRTVDGLAYNSVAIGGEPEAVGREMKCATVPPPKPGRCRKDLDHDVDGGRTASRLALGWRR
jgi:hypothetical protein